MKTIEMSDEDYETLMELSKELQTQSNHLQAFPYFWEPQSKRRKYNLHGEGSEASFIVDGEEVTLEDIYERFDDAREDFLSYYSEEYSFEELEKNNLVGNFEEYVLEGNVSGVGVFTYNYEYKSEHNPSLFLSDVQGFIEGNKHHLGGEPSTYARTIWRMPKMEKLVKLIYKFNKEHNEEVNHEAKIYMERK